MATFTEAFIHQEKTNGRGDYLIIAHSSVYWFNPIKPKKPDQI